MLSWSLTFLLFALQPLGLVLRDFYTDFVIFLRRALFKVSGLETLVGNYVELIFLPVILNLSASRLYGRGLFIIIIESGLAGYGLHCRGYTLGFRRLLALLEVMQVRYILIAS